MRIAYIDEAGYTGANLLDPEQPFLALSAVFVSEEEAKRLSERLFCNVQSQELKHKCLAKRQRYHRQLLEAQTVCLEEHDAVSYVADKRFLCILKLLDDCIEPCFHERGLDFYENGYHLLLATLFYHVGPRVWGTESFQRLLELYQQAAAEKSDETISELCSHARSLPECDLTPYISPISEKAPVFLSEIRDPTTSTNVAFSLLFGLLTQLERKACGPYEIVHDTSAAMKAYHENLLLLMECSEPRTFQISDVCSIQYPLNLKYIREADSRSETGLQFADILVGGVVSATKVLHGLTKPNGYASRVLSLYSDDNLMHLFPIYDPDEIAERFHGSQAQEGIEFLTQTLKEGQENVKMEGRCEKCRYWRPFRDRSGECHRNAPPAYVFRPEEDTMYQGTRWPLTTSTQVCGEFVENEDI